jgi:hypothetical protein
MFLLPIRKIKVQILRFLVEEIVAGGHFPA